MKKSKKKPAKPKKKSAKKATSKKATPVKKKSKKATPAKKVVKKVLAKKKPTSKPVSKKKATSKSSAKKPSAKKPIQIASFPTSKSQPKAPANFEAMETVEETTAVNPDETFIQELEETGDLKEEQEYPDLESEDEIQEDTDDYLKEKGMDSADGQ